VTATSTPALGMVLVPTLHRLFPVGRSPVGRDVRAALER
jgi:hypothetical protein